MSNFKKGDRVFSYSYQAWGTITAICDDNKLPLSVYFDDGFSYDFTDDGRASTLDKALDIFYDEVSITPPPKPLPDLKVDTKVLVWNNGEGSKWHRHFKEFSAKGEIVCFNGGQTSWSNSNGYTIWDNWEIAEDEGN